MIDATRETSTRSTPTPMAVTGPVRSRGARLAWPAWEGSHREPTRATAASRRRAPTRRGGARATDASVRWPRSPAPSGASLRRQPSRARATLLRVGAPQCAAPPATRRAQPCPARSPRARAPRPPRARPGPPRKSRRRPRAGRRSRVSRSRRAGAGGAARAASGHGARPARSRHRAPRSRAPPPGAPPPPMRRARRAGLRRRARHPTARGPPPRAPHHPAPSRASPAARGCRPGAPTAPPAGAARARDRATAPAPGRAAASGSSRERSSGEQGGAAGAGLVPGDEVRQRFGEKPVAIEPRGRDGPFDFPRLALDLEQHVHRGIPLEAQHRPSQAIDLHATVDAQRYRESQPLEDRHGGLGIRDARLGFRAVTITPALRWRALPPEHAVGSRAVGGPKHPQPQHFVAADERPFPVEAAVDHLTPERELGSGARERRPQAVGILDPRLDFELVRGRGRGRTHAKMAFSTAAVSASVSNTYAAPAAASAATS